MKALIRFGFFSLAFVAISLASGQDANGWFEQYCDGAEFHLTRFTSQPGAQELTFWFRTPISFDLYPMGSDWVSLSVSTTCSIAERCGDWTDAKMQFQKRAKHVVYGRYIADVKGKHMEGQFRVKEHRHKHPQHLCM